MTRLELAAIRLYKATQAARERSRKISSFICEREGDPRNGSQDRPCWKSRVERVERLDDETLDRVWPSANGDDEGCADPCTWCKPCQERQNLYLDKLAVQELGNAKRSFWAATKALIKACEV